jgi:hypothetical protein
MVRKTVFARRLFEIVKLKKENLVIHRVFLFFTAEDGT